MRFEEISKELGIPLKRVEKIYFKAMSKLRNRLTEEEREYLLELLAEEPTNETLLSTLLYSPSGKDKYP